MMLDIALMAVLPIFALISGFVLGRGRAERPIERIELGPNVCQCGHALSYHSKLGRDCNAIALDVNGRACKCMHYVSPFHVEEDQL